MRAINARAKKTMDILTAKCEHPGDHDKFHTEPYMDVAVEYIDNCNLGAMFSVAHYYEQNGDLMRDPEMCFIKGRDGKYYPYYYRIDGLGIERECIQWDEKGNVQGIQKNEQGNQAVFAGTWMRNIKRQQERGKMRRHHGLNVIVIEVLNKWKKKEWGKYKVAAEELEKELEEMEDQKHGSE